MAKQVNLDEFDANNIIGSFKTTNHLQDANEAGTKATVAEATDIGQPNEARRRRGKQDYEALFIREAGVTARAGKTVYIRKEYHDRIIKIVRVIGENDLSLFSYINNVLEHHFTTFQEEITTLYDKKNEGVF